MSVEALRVLHLVRIFQMKLVCFHLKVACKPCPKAMVKDASVAPRVVDTARAGACTSRAPSLQCPLGLLLYLASVYKSYRSNVYFEQLPIYIYRKVAARYNISGSRFHYNLGLRHFDKIGALYNHSCLLRRKSSAMTEVLRLGSRYYKRGTRVEIQEGGAFGCWFLVQPGSGLFVNTTDMLRTDRLSLFHDHGHLFAGLTKSLVMSDKVLWCDIARYINVTGFIFDKEIVQCSCKEKTSLSCVPGVRYGWDAAYECNCSRSKAHLECL